MSLLPQLGREVEVSALGRTWKFARLSVELLDKFRDWVRPQLPDPFDGLDKLVGHLPPDAAMQLIREAKEERNSPLDWDSPVIQKFRKTQRGMMMMWLFMLQVHQPEATLDDAMRLAAALPAGEVDRIFAEANGQDSAAPKASPPAA